ncbi:hypothetical protein PQ455_18580 [Sphingomonas naphthae]|uniref:Methionyl-tRNA formyltransferase n=1 Tax=Sphingomonas naphthae TaxID=1813468 RepID=A0ABY7TLL7_9SPHN|nr:hypothetical protein [Sphingomonas naphthae]WCT73587.1 hypothetical protein PQ455_18580 [Sphingomonas naphthae]
MATVRQLETKDLARVQPQGDVAATVSLVELDGEKFLQIDTYGSPDRVLVGKTSQSLRLSKAAFEQLSKLAGKHF